ncbi:ImmA/IrrE family metallo-endopeptidase [Paenibacillus sp. PL2-23]|uniref:ImmA/IrrE family metallo-endopeptidase n=1 Tax=Paenibacillus sp. PL2-23 TaxID=2100729 RepID=UPI0030F977B0
MIFDMTLYKPTELEKWICQKYHDNGIKTPADMDLDYIGEIFNTYITYKSEGDARVIYDDFVGGLIFLNIHDSDAQQRLKFFHELGHPALHAGSQDKLPSLFVELQEAQAGAFQQYAALPYFMLAEISPCHTFDEYFTHLSEAFRLPRSFVQRRIDQVKRRILQGHQDRNAYARRVGVAARYGYTDETLRILGQLHQQLSKQREAFS